MHIAFFVAVHHSMLACMNGRERFGFELCTLSVKAAYSVLSPKLRFEVLCW